jgi:hypothetical protein
VKISGNSVHLEEKKLKEQQSENDFLKIKFQPFLMLKLGKHITKTKIQFLESIYPQPFCSIKIDWVIFILKVIKKAEIKKHDLEEKQGQA